MAGSACHRADAVTGWHLAAVVAGLTPPVTVVVWLALLAATGPREPPSARAERLALRSRAAGTPVRRTWGAFVLFRSGRR